MVYQNISALWTFTLWNQPSNSSNECSICNLSYCICLILKTNVRMYTIAWANRPLKTLEVYLQTTAPPSRKGGNNTGCISCKRVAIYINLSQIPLLRYPRTLLTYQGLIDMRFSNLCCCEITVFSRRRSSMPYYI